MSVGQRDGMGRMRRAPMKLKMTDPSIRKDKPWWVVETAHYLLMFDDVARKMVSPPDFARRAERRLTTIASLLGLRKDKTTRRYPFLRRIPYFVHDPDTCKYGNVDVGGIDVPASSPHRSYQHEEAHAVLGEVAGSVPTLFNEGFASFAQSPRNERNHRAALAALDHNEVTDVTDILEFESFWNTYKLRGYSIYQQAGSFVAHLIGRFGSKKFIELCKSCSQEDRRSRVLRTFRLAYNLSLTDAEAEWKSFLENNRR